MTIQYPNLPTIRQVIHREELTFVVPPAEYELSTDSSSSSMDDNYQDKPMLTEPISFNQGARHDLIKDLDLFKEKANVLGSRLKQRNFMASFTSQLIPAGTNNVLHFQNGKQSLLLS